MTEDDSKLVAKTKKEAEEKAVEEADDGLSGTVTVYGIDIEPA